MARTDLTVQTIAVGGTALADEAANVDGEMFLNTGFEFLLVRNAHSASINVTLVTQQEVGGLAVADRVVAVVNATTKLIGPFPAALYNVASGADANKMYVDFSVITNIFVAAVRLPT